MNNTMKNDNQAVPGMNAYLYGKEEWNERYGSAIKHRNISTLVTIIALLIAGFAFYKYVNLASQVKVVPYVVEIDKLGKAVSAYKAKQSTYKNPKVIKYSLAEFITNFRTLYGNPVVQKDIIMKAYRYLSPAYPAYKVVNTYFQENSPFDALQTKNVVVKIDDVVQTNDSTYQIDWHEETYDIQGNRLSIDYYKASASIVLSPPTDESSIIKNPIGLFITHLNFAKLIK